MRAIILSVGDELVLGQVVDTNAAWLSARLVEAGVMPLYHQAVPDDLEAIAQTLRLAAGKADLLIVSGGLGPTPDDLTRQAIAAAAGVKLVLHGPSLKKLEKSFKERGRAVCGNSRVQAMFPEGAAILKNPIGTAPGFSIAVGETKIVAMPGVPEEMKLMFRRHVAPMLATRLPSLPSWKHGVSHGSKWPEGQSSKIILTTKLNAFGPAESLLAEKLGKMMRRDRKVLVGTTVSGGIISIRIRGVFCDEKKGAREMRKTSAEIKKRLGEAVFSEGDITLAEAVGKMLIASRKTVVTAESCTAGLLAAMLTEMPGASKYFLGGWVAYSNAGKTADLAVPEDLIVKRGAVSEIVVRKMAEGALRKAKSDFALALTGIAGPRGGSPQKKVGTVWIALAQKTGNRIKVYAEKYLFPGDRASTRERAAKTALNILRLRLLGS